MAIKISIITICRNAGEELQSTIHSVLGQTYPDIEYVFVDGNSTDEKTIKIIKEHKSRFHHYISEDDAGIYDAMNKGINRATGDLLLFINAGDRLADPYSIEAFVRLCEDKDAMVYYADVVWVDTDKKVVRAGLPEINNESDLYSKNFPHSGTFYRKKCFTEYGYFDVQYKILGDYEMNLRLLLKNRVAYCTLNTLVSFFYTGGISTSASGREKRQMEMDKIKSIYFESAPEKENSGILKRFTRGNKSSGKLNRI